MGPNKGGAKKKASERTTGGDDNSESWIPRRPRRTGRGRGRERERESGRGSLEFPKFEAGPDE